MNGTPEKTNTVTMHNREAYRTELVYAPLASPAAAPAKLLWMARHASAILTPHHPGDKLT